MATAAPIIETPVSSKAAQRIQKLLEDRKTLRIENAQLRNAAAKEYQRGFAEGQAWEIFKSALQQARTKHPKDFEEALGKVRALPHAATIFAVAEKQPGGAEALYELGGRPELLHEFTQLSADTTKHRFEQFIKDLRNA